MINCNAILWQLPKRTEKNIDKEKAGEDNLAYTQYMYGDRSEKSSDTIYSSLVEGHYAFSLSP